MAAVKTQKKGKSLFDDQPKPQGDLSALVEQFKENPALYVGAVAFIALCLVAGLLYRAHRNSVERDLYTSYAQALQEQDPAERLAALERLLESNGPEDVMAELAYVTAETAYWAQDSEKAKALFERVKTEYPESPYVPDAAEGLGYIAEDASDFDAALNAYKEIEQLWPTSFTARRQPLNVARVQEKLGNIEAAIQSYREQTTVFPESNVAREAQAALDRLGKSNPELFTPAEVEPSEMVEVDIPALDSQPALETAPPAEDAPALELKLDAPSSDSTEEALEQPSEAPASETLPEAPAETP
ncbi:MAG: tetratricopeptide repeat protein [Candidatus Hydrogenedentes bacterium]|nr:tetratricopeptide repeat protein [Candidatus Hydrogenedentota bacterium]